MRQIQVRQLCGRLQNAADVPETFEKMGINYHKIDIVNWASQYPYCPNMEFAVAHQGDAILLHYRVEENDTRAVVGNDLGAVWEDSCCESFISVDEGADYYNLETNCIGTVLLCNGEGRDNRTKAPAAILNQIDRWASLGRKPFGQREGRQAWELALAVPVSAFFCHHLQTLSGRTMRANFYKCGDKTPHPHFLSWNRISIPAPNFHRPDFFGELTFL